MAVKNLKQVALYLTPTQHGQLQKLSTSSRVPMQIYLREAVEALLKRYAERSKQ